MIRNRLAPVVDWCPPVAGVVFVLIGPVTLLSPDEALLSDLFDVFLPLGVGLVLLALTPRFRRLDVDAAAKSEIVWTAVVVGLLLSGVLMWEDVLLLMDGIDVPVGKRMLAIVNGLAIGALVGGIAGHHRVRTKGEIEDLADARHDFQEIFEKADVGIAVDDPDTTTLERVNQRYAELLGYERDELEGMPIGEISGDDPDFDQEQAAEFMERALAGEPQRFDWHLQRKDGSQVWSEVSLKRATIGGQVRLLAFIRDVSDRKERERKLEAHALELEKFREIYESADEAIGLTDPETGTIVEANPKYGEILGYEPGELEGKSIVDISADSAEFSQAEAMTVVEDAMAGEPQSLDWQLKRKDGSTVWVAVSLKRATIGDEDRLLVFFRDVSERKAQEAELDRHKSEMEFFNSLLRHDVLNAITVIRTHGTKLTKSLDGEERENAETIVGWADNVTDVVERVRNVLETLTGDAEQSFYAVDLSTELRSEVDQLERGYPEATVEADVPDDVHVAADDLLGEVLGNVLTNAVDHNPEDDLTVSVSVDPGPDTVTVEITDDGAGIPDEDKDAVFRRGETGHVKKTGSGFGLFFVDSMIDAYGGAIRVEDNEPSGAAIVMELPTAPE